MTVHTTDIKSHASATQCGDKTIEFEIGYPVEPNEAVVEVHEMNITSAVRYCTGFSRPNSLVVHVEQQRHRVVVAGKFISTTSEDNATLSTWPAEVQKRIQDKLAANAPGTWGYFIADPVNQAIAAGGYLGPDDEFQQIFGSATSPDQFATCYGRQYDFYTTFRAIPAIPTNGTDQSDLRNGFLVVQYVEGLGTPKITGLKVAWPSSGGVTTNLLHVQNNIGMCPSKKLLTEGYLKFNGRVAEGKDMFDLMFAAGLLADLDNNTVFLPPHAQVKALAADSNQTTEDVYAKYHVVNQDVTAAQLKTGQSFATLLGSNASLSFDSSNASLLVEEVVTKNGRIHKTSEVLTPPELRQVAPPSSAPTSPPSSAPSLCPAVLVPLLVVARLFF